MKIAVFYCGYLPGEKYGGPVTSIFNFTELLGDDNDIYIVCTNHDLKEAVPYSNIQSGWNKVGKVKVLYLPDSECKKPRFSKILDEIQPQLIYASSIFSAKQTYPLFGLSKRKNIPLLLAPRGELNNNALSIKKTKKQLYLLVLKLLRRMTTTFFQATSEEEQKSIIQTLGVDKKKVFLLPNVPSLPQHKKDVHKQPGQLKMCFVGRIVQNKNLLIALQAVSNVDADINFDIFGPCEDKDYWKLCQELIASVPSNITITYKGFVSPREMVTKYADYDCLISPTRFENYGQAIVEAMLHDVPVIISRGTTPWDEIDNQKVGFAVDITDIEGYSKAIKSIADMSAFEYNELIVRLRSYCIKRFDYAKLKTEYNELFTFIRRVSLKGNVQNAN